MPTVKNKVVLAPIVPVTFSYNNKGFSTFALVDSGASGAMISTVIADALGIEWDKIPASIGFTPSGQFRYHLLENIEANVNGHIFFLSMSIAEGISPYQCILGQNDLFKKAKITFEGYKKQFEIIFRQFN